MRIVTLHGINQTDLDYAAPLFKNLGKRPFLPVSISWGADVMDYVQNWRKLFLPRHFHWNPIRAFKRRIIRAGHESAVWVSAYDYNRKTIYTHILNRLNQAIDEGAEQFIIIGHSLGSVVLVDVLSGAIAAGALNVDRIRAIVTMGSPLYFWRSPDQLERFIADLAGCRWINLYDVDDPVAGQLAGLGRVADVEVHTGGLFSSHCNYWNSREVARIVGGLLKHGV